MLHPRRLLAAVAPLLVSLVSLTACSDDPADDPAGVGGGSGQGGSGGSNGGSGGAAGTIPAPPSTPDTPPEWNRTVTPIADAEASQKRASCEFKAGALPAETLGDKVAPGTTMPIDHFVLVMMENRSFDHYFQKLKSLGMDADVAPDDFSNTTITGKVETIHSMQQYCVADTTHGWAGVHKQVNGDKMDGFVTSNEKEGQDGARALGYLTPETAPMGYFLAQNFAISDRHFCGLQGPTWPNRMYFYASSSFGLTDNSLTGEDHDNLLEQMSKRGIDWHVYKTDTPGTSMFISTVLNNTDRYTPLAQFFDDAKAGTLPSVSYVDPGLLGNEARQSSQHPPANHQYGEQFFYDIVKAVTESPQWSRTALIITYDEHGGFYDHVVPPAACPPDDKQPLTGGDLGKFDHYGVRVPLLVVSPFAKKKFVSHVVTDHTSIVRLVQHRYQLPALSNRDANAEPILDMFDFDNPPFATPPALPERPGLDAAQEANCQANFQ